MADLPISGLPAAGALDGSELTVLNQAGTSVQLDLDGIAEYASGWVRPSDWPAMPADAANKISVLTAVYDSAANHVAIHAQVSAGTYDVDWGDGTSDIGVASNTQIDHQYTYSDPDLGPLTSRGYKTAIIIITPNTGGANFTSIDFGRKPAASNLPNDANAPWLDILINAPSCTNFTIRNTWIPRVAERIRFTALSASTTGLNFEGLSYLQNLVFPAGSLTGLTSFSVKDCRALRTVVFPSGSLAALTSLQNSFRDCQSLQAVTFPTGSLANVTNMEACFSGCQALRAVTFPSGALAACTTIREAFRFCPSLQSIVFPDLGTLVANGLQDTFSGCNSLVSIGFPTGSMGSLTTLSSPFGGCNVLRSIVNCEIPVSFSVQDCMLDATALDAIYTALPTVVGQTITVTGNIGISGDNPAIATGKGWTVTGS